MRLRTDRRPVHPGAWWVWALATATAATLTTNILVLALFLAATGLVVASCATSDGVRRYALYVWVAAAVVVIRVVFRCVFPDRGGTPLLVLPTVSIGPIDLFGTLTTQALVSAVSGGLQLATVILAVGAAHTLADVLQLLKHAPPSLAGLSTALVIAVSVFPELARSTQDVRRAARLRGGRSGLRGVVVPVLEATMERSVALAAAMEARGLGAARPAPGLVHGAKRLRAAAQPVFVLGAILCVAFAAYGLLDDAWPGWLAPALAGCAVACALGASLVDRTARRTVYRPDRWGAGSTLTAVSGLVGAFVVIVLTTPQVRLPALDGWPSLSVAALLGPLVVAVPGALTSRRSA
ncbi:cobalt ABC transporter permease [Sanguibacter antarcticus]|uniref:Energy-coupling factor transport system permease protein n=1 Tax=Sanguibacter antarcticus TaxID=372484 RepID=A0A2A9E1L7_9MICO|nr:cobalt ABC transporter permease [Sanguibacter antarcticus]PFG32937.1 energy-coupling factor transport system permease protein [Sanguibacter antarcticus]